MIGFKRLLLSGVVVPVFLMAQAGFAQAQVGAPGQERRNPQQHQQPPRPAAPQPRAQPPRPQAPAAPRVQPQPQMQRPAPQPAPRAAPPRPAAPPAAPHVQQPSRPAAPTPERPQMQRPQPTQPTQPTAPRGPSPQRPERPATPSPVAPPQMNNQGSRPGAQPGRPVPPATQPGAPAQPSARPGSPLQPGQATPPAGRPGQVAPQTPGQNSGQAPGQRPGEAQRPGDAQRPGGPQRPDQTQRPGEPARPGQIPAQPGQRPGEASRPGQPLPPTGQPAPAPGARPGADQNGRPGGGSGPGGVDQRGQGQTGPGMRGPDGRGPDGRGPDGRGPGGREQGRGGLGAGGALLGGAAIGAAGGFLAGQAMHRLDDVRGNRQESNEDGRTYIREPGRTIIRDRDRMYIRHDENERFRDLDRDMRQERRGDDFVTYFPRPNGEQIVTLTDRNGRMIKRSRRFRDGREIIIIDNSFGPRGGPEADLVLLPLPALSMPRERYILDADTADESLIYETLSAPPVAPLPQRYTLDQVRYSHDLRSHMRSVDLDTINFDTGSWTVTQDQAGQLANIAKALNQAISRNHNEVFLIEGYTDAVGNDVDNLSLSDRRAASVATILSQDFKVPPENLTTQGYGEQYLKVQTQEASRQNRRVTVRRITPLLNQNAQQ